MPVTFSDKLQKKMGSGPMDPKKKKALAVGAGVTLLGILAFVFWPKKASAAGPAEPGPNPSTARTIVKDDSLSLIAKSVYGQQYLAIMLLDRNRLNTGAVKHFNLIIEGQTLQIPTAAAVAALPASVKDAYKARWSAYQALGPSGWGGAVNPAAMNASIGAPTAL